MVRTFQVPSLRAGLLLLLVLVLLLGLDVAVCLSAVT